MGNNNGFAARSFAAEARRYAASYFVRLSWGELKATGRERESYLLIVGHNEPYLGT